MTRERRRGLPWILRDRAFWAAVLIGVALMAAVDEIVFHQLLGWHHLLDRATPQIGLLSDGLLHAAEVVGLAAGGFLLADAHRRRAIGRRVATAGVLCGMGAFQLFDAVVDHKLLRIHQIRYGVDLLPYDVAWVASAVALLAAGAVACALASPPRRPGPPAVS
ncbi:MULTISPECIES: DUF2243 domain-containing protein [unclassified Agrococcus]|uniref:DUF2243 domain-containing protein n=1 Tax=unclassified Agrococcus TaxID=2615065 RepID=UPI003613406E